MSIARSIRWPHVLVALAFTFTVQFVLIRHYLPAFLTLSGGLPNPDQLLWYEPDQLQTLYAALGDAGHTLYREMLVVDYLYATLAAVAYSMWITCLLRHGAWRWIAITPWVMTGFDFVENTLQLLLMAQWPALEGTWVCAAAIASLGKMVSSFVAMISLVFALFVWFRQRKIKL